MPRAAFSPSKIERALRVWQAAGLSVGAIEIREDGSFRIETGKDQKQDSALDRWIASQGAGDAHRDETQGR